MGIFGEILQKIFGGSLPEQAAANAHLVDDLYNVMMVISFVGFFGLMGVMTYFVIRYHKSNNDKSAYIPHNALAETIWTVVPTIIFVATAVWGLWAYYEAEKVPEDALKIKVVGKQWAWEFGYTNDEGYDFSVPDVMYVPINTPIVTDMTTTDVLHSFYIPSFRVKRDTVPGMRSKVTFTPTKLGDFNIFCAEFCGTSHSKMRGIVRVVSQQRFDKWLNYEIAEKKFLANAKPSERGQRLFNDKGCTSCHKIDGGALIGPPINGLWGSTREFEKAAPITADAEYIRESILNPKAKIVRGYQPVMNSFAGQLNEQQIDDIIEYIKTLK
jgi:cytochrome c oxidase subunit 2